MTFGALVLSGGAASRMGGREKALLPLGQRTFLSHLEQALTDFDEKLLSTNTPSLASGTPFLPIADRLPGRGPLEGIYCALTACRSDALLVVACDMPLFPASLAQQLVAAFGSLDAMVCRDSCGDLHPLCGVYAKTCLPVMEEMLEAGDYKVRNLLSRVSGGIFDLPSTLFPDDVLLNVNTPEMLESLRRRKDFS